MPTDKPNGRRTLPAAMEKFKFKPGQCGNPKGRPPNALRLTTAYREILDQVVPEELRLSLIPPRLRSKIELKKGTTFKELLALRAILEGAKGNIAALKEIADRDEGKPKQRIELVGDQGNEIKIRVVYDQVIKRSMDNSSE